MVILVVLFLTVDRKNNFIRKKSTTVDSEKAFQSAMDMNAVGGGRPTFGTGWERQERQFNSNIKEQVKVSLTLKHNESHLEKTNTLEKQGDCLYLAELERVMQFGSHSSTT